MPNSSPRLIRSIVQAIEQHHGFTLHAEQMQCGQAMTRRVIAEMATGEGKTAAAVLTAGLLVEQGQQLFVATANDYLARRDAAFATPVLHEFGHSCAAIHADMPPQERQLAYRAGVVYGALREFVFDFLRDSHQRQRARDSSRLHEPSRGLQSPPAAILCDEADSILIDESLTPFILSDRAAALPLPLEQCLRATAGLAPLLQAGIDYSVLPKLGIALTPQGRMRIDAFPFPLECRSLTRTEIQHCAELSIRACRDFQRDRHYLIRHDEVLIVDEFTGRLSEGRQWSAGIHQAIEAKEGLPLTTPSQAAATITTHDFLKRFPHVCGMTGTALEAAAEFRSVFQLDVELIPPHHPSRREILPAAVFRTRDEKWRGLIEDVRLQLLRGRAVMIGTRTIEASEELSGRLAEQGLEHVVLNARNPELESGIVAQAGQPGRVTVATNMAGRGTDIRLHPSVKAAGGLHVIGTELHASRRIDRQLIGRCGRQGDPGTYQACLSLDDAILVDAFGEDFRRQLQLQAWNSIRALKILQRAQRRVEQRDRQRRSRAFRHHDQCHQTLLSLGLDPVLTPYPDSFWNG